jgi:hypothetical protein
MCILSRGVGGRMFSATKKYVMDVVVMWLRRLLIDRGV